MYIESRENKQKSKNVALLGYCFMIFPYIGIGTLIVIAIIVSAHRTFKYIKRRRKRKAIAMQNRVPNFSMVNTGFNFLSGSTLYNESSISVNTIVVPRSFTSSKISRLSGPTLVKEDRLIFIEEIRENDNNMHDLSITEGNLLTELPYYNNILD